MNRLRLRGIAASPGIAIAPAVVIERREVQAPRFHVDADRVDEEIARLREGVRRSMVQLADLKGRLEDTVLKDEGLILDAHLLILKDDMLIEDAARRISEEQVNAEWAVQKTAGQLAEAFKKIDDPYLRERSADVVAVSSRLIHTLLGRRVDLDARVDRPSVVVAHDLSPADTVHMMNQPIVAFCTDVGTRTSHTAIMAKALGIPAVVGLERITERVSDGDLVIIDGAHGHVVLRPEPRDVAEYEDRQRFYEERDRNRLATRHLPAQTVDGIQIAVMGNIEMPGEAAIAMDQGAAGIGLYRTEFLFIDRSQMPDEEEQYKVYKAVVETVAPHPVTLRTFDLGGDKFVSRFETPQEINPALGLRAVRLGLKEPRIFKIQLRAMLRASARGHVRIMFPMISGVGEYRQARALLWEAAAELRRARIPFAENIDIGTMIELPSAVITSRQLAREARFFSIGTNDLIQYALAIDRVNEHVAYLYHPLHPAIVSAIRSVVSAGAETGIPVSLCGAMAEDPKHLLVLAGLGIREISVPPSSVPTMKEVVRALDIRVAKDLVERIFKLATSNEVESLVNEAASRHLADFIDDD